MVGMRGGAAGAAHAQALLRQLKQLNTQHAQVLEAYERRLNTILAEGPGLGRLGSGALGNKRPSEVALPEGPEAKKQRLASERAARRKALWDEIAKIVEKLKRHTKGMWFKEPVHPVKHGVPDYHKFISRPMDLGTVLTKVRKGQYEKPIEVANDVRLVWSNCLTYNGPNHNASLDALYLSEQFEKEWGKANFEQRWIILSSEVDDDGLAGKLRNGRELLGTYMASRELKEGRQPGYLGPMSPDRDMTFEEKRKLSAMLVSLPGEKMDRVLEILQEHQPIPEDTADEDEVELDLDAVNNKCLWELKKYADSVLSQGAAPPKKTTPGNRAGGGPANKRPPGGGGAAAGGGPAGKTAPAGGGAAAAAAGGGAGGGSSAAAGGGGAAAGGGAGAVTAAGAAADAANNQPGGQDAKQEAQPTQQQQQQGEFAVPQLPKPAGNVPEPVEGQGEADPDSPPRSEAASHQVPGGSASGFAAPRGAAALEPSAQQSGVGATTKPKPKPALDQSAAALQADAWASGPSEPAAGEAAADKDDVWANASKADLKRVQQEKAEKERLEALEKEAERKKEEQQAQEQQAAEAEVENMQQQAIQGDDVNALAAVSHVARDVGGGAAGVLLKKEEEASEMCLD